MGRNIMFKHVTLVSRLTTHPHATKALWNVPPSGGDVWKWYQRCCTQEQIGFWPCFSYDTMVMGNLTTSYDVCFCWKIYTTKYKDLG